MLLRKFIECCEYADATANSGSDFITILSSIFNIAAVIIVDGGSFTLDLIAAMAEVVMEIGSMKTESPVDRNDEKAGSFEGVLSRQLTLKLLRSTI